MCILWNVFCEVCSVRYILWSVLFEALFSEICSVICVLCCVLCEVCSSIVVSKVGSLWYVLWGVPFEECSVSCVLWGPPCEVCSLRSILWGVLCEVCSMREQLSRKAFRGWKKQPERLPRGNRNLLVALHSSGSWARCPVWNIKIAATEEAFQSIFPLSCGSLFHVNFRYPTTHHPQEQSQKNFGPPHHTGSWLSHGIFLFLIISFILTEVNHKSFRVIF